MPIRLKRAKAPAMGIWRQMPLWASIFIWAGSIWFLKPNTLYASEPDCHQALRSFDAAFDPWSNDHLKALGARLETPRDKVEKQYQLALHIFQAKLQKRDIPDSQKRQFEEAISNIHAAWKIFNEANLKAAPSDSFVDPFDYAYWRRLREELEAADHWKDDGSIRKSKLAAFSDTLSLELWKRGDQNILVVTESPEDIGQIAQQALTIEAGKELIRRSRDVVASYPTSTKASMKHFEVFVLANFLRQQEFPFAGYAPKPERNKSRIFSNDSSITWVEWLDFGLRTLPVLSLFVPKSLGATTEQSIWIIIATFGVAVFAYPSMVAFKGRTEASVIADAQRGSWFDRILRWNQNRRLLKRVGQILNGDRVFSEDHPLTVLVGRDDRDVFVSKLYQIGFRRDHTFEVESKE